MLNILYGRAGAQKTTQIMLSIKQKMAQGETGMLLIVPEQYSHYAERQLCKVCGDAMSLHAEVLTFTRLCGHVFEQTGGAPEKVLDKSGRILVMHRALESVMPSLKVFGMRKTRTQMLESLLAQVMEFRAMCLTPQSLDELAKSEGIAGTPLSDKLSDFALIFGAYNALLEDYGSDATERLLQLSDKIAETSFGSGKHIYFDGFIDFTAPELRVIQSFLSCNANITVCITGEYGTDGLDPGYADIFKVPAETIGRLGNLVSSPSQVKYTRVMQGQESETPETANRAPELEFLEKHLFDDVPPKYNNLTSDKPITVIEAPSCYIECEQAAMIIKQLICSGHRWRDIVVMARDFAQYESICEYVFANHGIPYFSGGKVGIDSKPPIALIDTALCIADTGFQPKDVIRYIKTGLLDLSVDEIAVLENYISIWNIKGSAWLKPWILPPSGYSSGNIHDKQKQADAETLRLLNILREKIVRPLSALRESVKEDDAASKLKALYDFICQVELPKSLLNKADEFARSGQQRLSREYTQLFDIIIDALDQMYIVLEGCELTTAEFRKLSQLVFSQHDVGVIPISIDRLAMGGMAMSRRRDIKCLIILGATDENLPSLSAGIGVLSDNERTLLSKIDKRFPSGMEERLYREMNMLYSTVTLPSEKLVLLYDTSEGKRPTYLIPRLCEIFGITVTKSVSLAELKMSGDVQIQTKTDRGVLTPNTARELYGENMKLSASRVDRFYACPYKHFLSAGLRLTERRIAEFDAMNAGNYTHFVLDKVFSELDAAGIMKTADDMMLVKLADKYTEQFVDEVLHGFEGKDERFRYLFRRYQHSVMHTLRNMAAELQNSDFAPVEFEMDISEFYDAGRGFIDRVDKYETDGKLYLRVVDYKTRKKAYAFNLGDVYNGRDMQMLIYMFALQNHGERKFGQKPVPAGVLYVPARDVIISVDRDATEDKVEKERIKCMRRSGLVLRDEKIKNAMETGGKSDFLPNKADAYVTDKHFEILSMHIDRKMTEATEEILAGNTDCRPYYKNKDDNACSFCEYTAVCRFDEKMGDKPKYVRKMTNEEVFNELGFKGNE